MAAQLTVFSVNLCMKRRESIEAKIDEIVRGNLSTNDPFFFVVL